MSFVSITKPAVGDPTRKTLADTIIDDLTDLNARVSSFASAAIANGSFEFDVDSDGIPDGWTRTLYSGGSSAINTSNHVSGDQSFSFTSTVLANGGGDLLQTDFSVVAGGKDYPVEAWIKASVANVSASAEVRWYDSAQAYISSSTLANLTNTPTTFTSYGTFVAAPATARFAKFKLVGGVPGAGSATGTIYFDAVGMGEVPELSISNSMLAPATVTQGKLDTSLQQSSASIADGATTNVTFTGGTYALGWGMASTNGAVDIHCYNSGYVAGVGLTNPGGGGSRTYYLQARYINATAPYNLGNGDIALFVFAEVDPAGNVVAIDCANAPPWYYNGPHRYDPRKVIERAGKKFMRLKRLFAEFGTLKQALASGTVTRAQLLDRLATDPEDEVEITHAVKNRDMPLIPHPFPDGPRPGNTIVLLNPVGPLTDKLALLHDSPDALTVTELFMDGQLKFDNTPLPVNAPPGVLAVAGRWKLTP